MATKYATIEMRQDGDYWAAYVVTDDNGRMLLATVAMAAVSVNPRLRSDFIELVKGVFAQGMATISGDVVEVLSHTEIPMPDEPSDTKH